MTIYLVHVSPVLQNQLQQNQKKLFKFSLLAADEEK